MATDSSVLAWRIPWTEEPGGLQSMGLQRVGHNWAINTHTLKFTFFFFSHFGPSSSLEGILFFTSVSVVSIWSLVEWAEVLWLPRVWRRIISGNNCFCFSSSHPSRIVNGRQCRTVPQVTHWPRLKFEEPQMPWFYSSEKSRADILPKWEQGWVHVIEHVVIPVHWCFGQLSWLGLTVDQIVGKKCILKLSYRKLKQNLHSFLEANPLLCLRTLELSCIAQHRVIRRFWARCPQGRARLLPSLLGLLGAMKKESRSFWSVSIGELMLRTNH